MPRPLDFMLMLLAGWLNRGQLRIIEYLREENRVLRAQLKSRPRLSPADRIRLAKAARPLGRQTLAQVSQLFSPETILRWYRNLVARKYNGQPRRQGSPGRPRTDGELHNLIMQLAIDNPGWGYTRLRGALHNLGRTVGRTTIQRILTTHGLHPAPTRRTSWTTFIKAHFEVLAATDFFTVEVRYAQTSPTASMRLRAITIREPTPL